MGSIEQWISMRLHCSKVLTKSLVIGNEYETSDLTTATILGATVHTEASKGCHSRAQAGQCRRQGSQRHQGT